MADLQFSTHTPEVALTASASKTVLKVTAPANQRLKLLEWGVYFDGVSATTEPAIVELVRLSSSGTMSATGTVKNDDYQETIQSVAEYDASSEPTVSAVLEPKEVHPQSGYEKAYGLGLEPRVPGGGRMGIKITAAADVNVRAWMKFEE